MIIVSVIVNLVGLTLLFIGNRLVTDAVTRWGSSTLPNFKRGNRLQVIGFIISIVGILLAVID